MNSEPPPLPPRRPITLGVILAFVPAALGLLLGTLPIPKAQMSQCCVAAAIAAFVCCVTASVLLFRRSTAASIVFGILLLLLNFAIIAGMGCAALLTTNLH